MHEIYQNLPYYLDPIILDLKYFKLSWYWIMYLVAFSTVILLVRYRYKNDKANYIKNIFKLEKIIDILIWMFFGVIIGGRLGYVIFYNLQEFISKPLSIINPFQTTEAGIEFVGLYGMSYHGGLIGAGIVLFILSRKKRFDFFKFSDFIIPAIPLGYFFGRLGNFINGELYGRETESFLGMYFPRAIYSSGGSLRHPSQLYEALFEGIISFIILWKLRNKLKEKGSITVIFLLLYSIFRFFIEFFREPDSHLGLYFGFLSMGQILSLLMFIFSIFLIFKNHIKIKLENQ